MNGYFRAADPRVEEVAGFKIPPDWWSRFYEYAWALSLAGEGQVVLDAGSGFGHPLKYALAEKNLVYAVDFDPAIETKRLGENLFQVRADLCHLSFAGKESFETIYCISTLEHLRANDRPRAWAEFARVLAAGGRIVLTVDLPYCQSRSLYYTSQLSLNRLLAEIPSSLRPIGAIDRKIPPDAIHHDGWNLAVYHLLLEKAT